MQNLDIFISHSSKDEKIAAALIELLRDALSIPASRIRCTSVDGYRLPIGARVDDILRQEVSSVEVFIGIITPASLQSTYVLFELGARWGTNRYLAPVLASGSDASLLRAPLTSLNILSCDKPAQIYQLVNDLAYMLKKKSGNPASYRRRIDKLARISKGYKKVPSTMKRVTPMRASTTRNNAPELLAAFELKNGKPIYNKEEDGYEIRLYMKNVPRDTQSVIYELDETYLDYIRKVKKGAPDFQEYITSYGDYEISATVKGKETRKVVTGWLSTALEKNYEKRMSDSIRRAIKDIEEN